MDLSEISTYIQVFLKPYVSFPSWPLSIVLAVLIVIVGELLLRLGFALTKRLFRNNPHHFDEILVRRIRLPARAILLGVSIQLVLRLQQFKDTSVLYESIVLAKWLFSAYLILQLFDLLLLRYWFGEKQQIQVPPVVRHLILILLGVGAVLSIIGSVTGINMLPLLATSTVFTVVLGLALQDTLGNLFAGLALHIEKTFEIGDWILVDGIEGKVVYLGWRSTRLQTLSWDIISLPNSTIAKARLQNFVVPTPATARLVEVFVSLDASPEAVEEAVKKCSAQIPEILQDPAPRAWLHGNTPLYQRYVIKFWHEEFPNYNELESSLRKKLWYHFHEAGLALSASTAAAISLQYPPQVVSAAKVTH